MDTVVTLAFVLVLCCASGVADARGFLHASRVWSADQIVWIELLRSATGFAVGISLYWVSLRFMPRVGMGLPEVQTMTWFAATIVGVAVASGRFGKWPVADQAVAAAVIAGLGWLLVRTARAH